GTENVPFIAALGKAAEIASQNLEAGHEYLAIKKLKEKLVKGILNAAGEIAVNGDRKKALVNTVNVSFKNIEGESVVMMLDSAGIAVSSGSACTSGTLQPSHVLSAMGVEPIIAQGSIRFSLSRYNTEEEIEYVVEKLGGIVRKLRKISPL
ncbi:MAG: aminotransferase class V-fold PLP-dependent enzyme, partial [Elusimicrobiota bacterium]|nr:aminotransferase class V-fold PLP-dependent enzyme [Elusimicrobiota bacterium]